MIGAQDTHVLIAMMMTMIMMVVVVVGRDEEYLVVPQGIPLSIEKSHITFLWRPLWSKRLMIGIRYREDT